MGSIGKSIGRHGRAGAGRMLQSLYEAARKEVFADPAAALRKYHPEWQPFLPAAAPKSRHHR